MSAPNEKIWCYFKYAQDAFRSVGISLRFPKNTDPTKTYMWRYLVNFKNKAKEWEISDSTAERLIISIVAYAKRNNLLGKGLSILSSDKVLEVGYKDIQKSIGVNRSVLERLAFDHKFVTEKCENHNVLLEQDGVTMPNIVKWYIQGRLSKIYLAVSKSCSKAMSKLSSDDLSMMPDSRELLLIRRQYFKDVITKHKAKSILGDDWQYGI